VIHVDDPFLKSDGRLKVHCIAPGMRLGCHHRAQERFQFQTILDFHWMNSVPGCAWVTNRLRRLKEETHTWAELCIRFLRTQVPPRMAAHGNDVGCNTVAASERHIVKIVRGITPRAVRCQLLERITGELVPGEDQARPDYVFGGLHGTCVTDVLAIATFWMICPAADAVLSGWEHTSEGVQLDSRTRGVAYRSPGFFLSHPHSDGPTVSSFISHKIRDALPFICRSLMRVHQGQDVTPQAWRQSQRTRRRVVANNKHALDATSGKKIAGHAIARRVRAVCYEEYPVSQPSGVHNRACPPTPAASTACPFMGMHEPQSNLAIRRKEGY